MKRLFLRLKKKERVNHISVFLSQKNTKNETSKKYWFSKAACNPLKEKLSSYKMTTNETMRNIVPRKTFRILGN